MHLQSNYTMNIIQLYDKLLFHLWFNYSEDSTSIYFINKKFLLFDPIVEVLKLLRIEIRRITSVDYKMSMRE